MYSKKFWDLQILSIALALTVFGISLFLVMPPAAIICWLFLPVSEKWWQELGNSGMHRVCPIRRYIYIYMLIYKRSKVSSFLQLATVDWLQ